MQSLTEAVRSCKIHPGTPQVLLAPSRLSFLRLVFLLVFSLVTSSARTKDFGAISESLLAANIFSENAASIVCAPLLLACFDSAPERPGVWGIFDSAPWWPSLWGIYHSVRWWLGLWGIFHSAPEWPGLWGIFDSAPEWPGL